MFRQLFASVAVTGAVKIVGLLVGLGSLALTSRILGPEGRGYVAVITTWVGLFATLGNLSLGQVALARAAGAGDDPDWLPSSLGVVLVPTVVVPIACGIATAVALLSGVTPPWASMPAQYVVLAWLLLPTMMFTAYASSLLTAADRLATANRAQLTAAVVSLGSLALLLVVLDQGVAGAIAALIVGQLAAACVGLVALLRRAGGRILLRARALREYVRDGSRLHLTAIGAFLFSSLDILMVDHFRGKAEAGYFQVGVQLFMPLLLAPQAVSDVLASKLSVVGVSGIWPHQKRLIMLVTAGMVVVAGLLAIAAPQIVRLVAGPEFTPSVGIFRIYLLIVVASTLNGAMAMQWIGRGWFGRSSMITLLAGGANFGLNLAFIPRWGATGAAAATVVGAYALPFIANLWMWRRCEREARASAAGALAPGVRVA